MSITVELPRGSWKVSVEVRAAEPEKDSFNWLVILALVIVLSGLALDILLLLPVGTIAIGSGLAGLGLLTKLLFNEIERLLLCHNVITV